MTPASRTPLTEVAPGVLVATAGLYRTTTTVVSAGGRCLVVDPAVEPADLDLLAGELRDAGLTPVAGLATHAHWDHLLWSTALGDVPRWASGRTARDARTGRARLVAEADASAPGHDHRLTGRVRPLPADEVPWEGPLARTVVHDAHAPGHTAVLLQDLGVLLAGDMLSDLEVPLLHLPHGGHPDEPVATYRWSLDLLEALVAGAGVQVLVPGHGTVATGARIAARFAADRAYLGALEAGRPPEDPRLADPWVAGEHTRQAAWLAHRGARPARS